MEPKRDDSELIVQFCATHDPGLRDEVVLRYVPLVHFVLGRLGMSQALGPDYEDAASQGLLGLIEAVDRYNPAFGAQFSTYATLRIRGKVIDHLRSQDWLSRGARQRARLVQDGIAELWVQLGRAPTDQELAAHLKLDQDKLRRALVDGSRTFVSLDMVISAEGDDQASLHELLPDENGLEPPESYEEQELQARLGQAIRSLPEREQLVLSLYYYEDLTFKEIGAVLEVSESRVCQLHGRAVLSLRAFLERSPGESRSEAVPLKFSPSAKVQKQPATMPR
jgi:RNA polymerase sigma factor for flagellar operon FliA